MSTGIGVVLVVAGVILRFAVASSAAQVAGVIVTLAGIFALLLSLLVWGPLNRRRAKRTSHSPPGRAQTHRRGEPGPPGLYRRGPHAR
jgi:hypothetical protein